MTGVIPLEADLQLVNTEGLVPKRREKMPE